MSPFTMSPTSLIVLKTTSSQSTNAAGVTRLVTITPRICHSRSAGSTASLAAIADPHLATSSTFDRSFFQVHASDGIGTAFYIGGDEAAPIWSRADGPVGCDGQFVALHSSFSSVISGGRAPTYRGRTTRQRRAVDGAAVRMQATTAMW